MSNNRNITFLIPKDLLDQINKRSQLNGRSRNAEMRYLLLLGLEYAGENDTVITLPRDGWVRGIGRISVEIQSLIEERATIYQRSLGREIVRLLAYAIQASTDRDLKLIKEMMQRQGQSALAPV